MRGDITASAWMAAQLMAAREIAPARYNPRPPGVIVDGATTSVVLHLLTGHPRRWWTQAEIVHRVARPRGSVSWSLVYLRAQGWIETTPDDARNVRYLRYRACAGGPAGLEERA